MLLKSDKNWNETGVQCFCSAVYVPGNNILRQIELTIVQRTIDPEEVTIASKHIANL